ncbi:hypothetical protein [Janthinobacterium sp. RB2P8]|uniref:hypothetical protein n=1 Tax=Janthinobacterium sp. RB2P8 TaxID=3424191 RepID=UPI003F264251
MSEPVYMVWDLDAGRRTGSASCQGLPHYFACPMTADGDEYAQHFTLTPISAPLLAQASAACRHAARLRGAMVALRATLNLTFHCPCLAR